MTDASEGSTDLCVGMTRASLFLGQDGSLTLSQGPHARAGSGRLGPFAALRGEEAPPVLLARVGQGGDRVVGRVLAGEGLGIVVLDARAVVLPPVRDAVHTIVRVHH